MKTYAHVATTTLVATTLPAYAGSLARFLERQAAAKAAALAEAQQEQTLHDMRANITSLVAEAGLFTEEEQLRANDNVHQTTCVAQLQRWFRNVYRIYQERALSLGVSFADGTSTHFSVAA